MAENLTNNNDIGFVLDISNNNEENKKYDLGKVVFVNNSQEQGIYIGLGTGDTDNNSMKIFSTKDKVENASVADKAKAIDISQQIGNTNNPVFISSTGFPTKIDFTASSTQVNTLKGTTLVSQLVVEELIDTKISNLPAAVKFKGIVNELPSLNDENFEAGDVIILGNKEYILAGEGAEKNWYEFGDNSNYVDKNFQITGITNNPISITGNFNSSPIVISHSKPNPLIIPATAPGEDGLRTITVGDNVTIPQITIDEFGHIKSAATVSVAFPKNNFDDYKVGTTELTATAEDINKTLLTQNVIVNTINTATQNINESINTLRTELQTSIDNIGSLKFIGNFASIPSILEKTENGKTVYYILGTNNEEIPVTNGNLITVGASGDQYICYIDETTNPTTKQWQLFGNSSNYVLKNTLNIVGTGILSGGGTLNSENIEISHKKSQINITSPATVSDNFGSSDNIPVLSVDEYGHIYEISTVPSKLKGYYITNTATDIPAATASAIITQSGIENIINDTLDSWKTNFSNPLSYQGIKTELPSAASSEAGHIVLIPVQSGTLDTNHSYTEYIYNGSAWESIGDDSLYAYKITEIIGTGILEGGGTLSADREITHKTSGIATGIYGGANAIPIFSVDQWGHITNVATSIIQTGNGPIWQSIIRVHSYDQSKAE